MDDKLFQHPGQILREGRLGLFTQSPFLPVHFHWTTTKASLFSGKQAHQGKSLSPVAWMAAWRETETLKPIDKAIVWDGERVPGP